MYLLAIDPGYEKVGYAVFDKSGTTHRDVRFIASDLITTPRSLKHEARLLAVFQQLEAVIQQYSIEQMVIEELFFSKNKTTALKVAQASGVIELLAALHHIPIARIKPIQIKQIITGYGGADKKAVQKMILLELGNDITFKDDDESDAVACGLAFCFQNNALR